MTKSLKIPKRAKAEGVEDVKVTRVNGEEIVVYKHGDCWYSSIENLKETVGRVNSIASGDLVEDITGKFVTREIARARAVARVRRRLAGRRAPSIWAEDA